jgi:thioredoxin-like negative regulator of GroEL
VGSLAQEEFPGIVNFFILDAGANRGFIGTLNIKGVPTFLFYKNGKLFDTLTGSHLKKDQIREKTGALIRWDSEQPAP